MVYDCRGLDAAEYLYTRQGLAGEATPSELSEAHQLRKLQEESAREADAIICVSNAMRRWMVRELDVPEEKITVIPCCVDAEVYRDVDRLRSEARSTLGLENKFVVTYCGSLMSWQSPGIHARCVQGHTAH